MEIQNMKIEFLEREIFQNATTRKSQNDKSG
jgi:hypothetical protein